MKRRFILHGNTLIERDTGLRWHIPNELMNLLDLKQITIKHDRAPPLEKPALVTIHDLPSREGIRITGESLGGTRRWERIQ